MISSEVRPVRRDGSGLGYPPPVGDHDRPVCHDALRPVVATMPILTIASRSATRFYEDGARPLRGHFPDRHSDREGVAMRLRQHLVHVGLVFVEDSLADLEGILREVRTESGAEWSAGSIRWIRQHRVRLRRAMRRKPSIRPRGAAAGCLVGATWTKAVPDPPRAVNTGREVSFAVGGRGIKRALQRVAIREGEECEAVRVPA